MGTVPLDAPLFVIHSRVCIGPYWMLPRFIHICLVLKIEPLKALTFIFIRKPYNA